MLKKIFLFFFTLALLIAASGAATLYYLVAIQPSEDVELASIKEILGKESNVYYSDGQSRLGVFFDETHRQYVDYEDIPENFIRALVAAEDNRFFEHFGFDPYGITRALIANFKAGRIVQGGSTLTQQTAKNLFKRKDRSIEEKLKELLFALRLEWRYSKEQIFEFYANQFYVSGNGHGLGIAARYYFNKLPAELTLVECAFIAGSVKRPNYYNPHSKKSLEATDLAIERATVRIGYVLGKMKDLGYITEEEYIAAKETPIPFNKGQFGYEFDYTMELVRDAVEQPFITEALAENGIDNISTSGISIITSINKEVQDKALYGLRRQLSELDVRLRGYERAAVQEEIKQLEYEGDDRIVKDAFLFGTVASIVGKDKNVQIEIDFGPKVGKGFIDYKGLSHLVAARTQYTKNRWATPKHADYLNLLKQIQVGDRLWTSVREIDEEGSPVLDLEKYPEVQGGALVLRKGAIQAVVGGTENRFFNRATKSKRTIGSAFKPFVYAASIQLGWNAADALNNQRNLFVFHNQAYFPRPDHISPFKWVSMSWAGTKSENLASIWLLYHLTDRLSKSQFTDLAHNLGFTPKTVDGKQEPYTNYQRRIRDHYGINVNNSVLKEAAYNETVRNIETDFLFEGLASDYEALRDLHYGYNFDRYRRELASQKQTLSGSEYGIRMGLLSNSFLRCGELKKGLLEYRQKAAWDFDFFDPFEQIAPAFSSSNGPSLYQSLKDKRYYFGYFESNDNFARVSPTAFVLQQNSDYFWNSVVLGSTISLAAYNMVEEQMAVEYQKLKQKNAYDFETLSAVRDFRITVGLHYLISLARQTGVTSHLEPVLSFPLGSNSVSLLEATRMYEAMITGKHWIFSDEDHEIDGDEIGIIKRIETPDGRILYEAKPYGLEVIDPQTTLETSGILENVVKYGTGREAKKVVKLSSDNPALQKELDALKIEVPLLGKTGTANNYTNASFLGYLPGFDSKRNELTLNDGFTIATYVGFDDNKPMQHKTIRIAGASGALAPWNTIVNQLIDSFDYAENLDIADLKFDGLRLERPQLGQVDLAMNPQNGGLLVSPTRTTGQSQPHILTFTTSGVTGMTTGTAGESLRLGRYYRPFWQPKGLKPMQ